ncbi:MAG: glycerate kinase [Ferruginibacter sp.]
MLHILIAPNAFKNSLSAQAAAEAIQRGLHNSKLDCTCECFPVGDGGDGTGELIMQKCNGERYEATVKDPIGRDITAAYGIINSGDACVIEMADASGLRLLKKNELNPLRATSFGTGQLIKAALDKGIRKIILCMGGSATVDGGCGILSALGIRFLDAAGTELLALPERLVDLASIDFSNLDERILSSEITVLCDVDNKLLGAHGAAAVFGPQKGASPEDIKILEQALSKLAAITLQQTGIDMAAIKYGGTAGGAAAGLHGLINARLVNGINYFLDITAFESSLQKSAIVITGEGSIDEQTLQGKGPFGVASRAKKLGKPVIALAGKVPLTKSPELSAYFDVLLSIGNEPMELKMAMAATAQNLERTALELGNTLSIGRFVDRFKL